MTVVIDASVVLKWLLRDPGNEPGTEHATALMESIVRGQLGCLQPFHWLAEVAAVLSRLTPGTAADDVLQLQALDLPTTDDPLVLRRACGLAIRDGTHAFDSLYHAVALETPGAMLITADASYLRAARAAGSLAHLDDWRGALA